MPDGTVYMPSRGHMVSVTSTIIVELTRILFLAEKKYAGRFENVPVQHGISSSKTFFVLQRSHHPGASITLENILSWAVRSRESLSHFEEACK